MAITLDNIARALIKWCGKESQQLKDYWALEGGWEQQASADFIEFLKQEYQVNEIGRSYGAYKTPDKTDWIFNINAEKPSEKILAELTCESFDNKDSFESEVEKEMKKLSPENLKEEYRAATRCIVSIYFNNELRRQLHDREFIEIFNNHEVGCAMKRL